MSRKLLYSFAIFYLALPTVIFLLTWTNLFIGIPLALGILGVALSLCKNFKGYTPIGSPLVVLSTCIVIALWITLAGVGGFLWQNNWDHDFRNALFIDLVRCPWPVTQGNEMLIYYLGYWLPAAGLAKLCGSLTLGWILQSIWAWLGIMTALWIIFDYIGKIKFSVIILLIFVGSIDIIPALVRNVDDMRSGILPFIDAVIENWGGIGFIEWPDVLIFWVYNQFIPSFLGCMLIFKCNDARITVFTMAMLLLTAPFSEVLLAVIAICQLVMLVGRQRNTSLRLKALFSSVNILSLLLLVVIGSYITSNHASGNIHLNMTLLTPCPNQMFYWKLLFSLLSFCILPWILLNLRNLYREPLFYILFITYIPCMFIQMGEAHDFLSRSVLPLLFYLFLKLSQTFADTKGIKKQSILWKSAFTICIVLSAVTPILGFTRCIYNSVITPPDEWRRHGFVSIFKTEFAHDNFTGDSNRWIFSRTYHSTATSLTEDIELYQKER